MATYHSTSETPCVRQQARSSKLHTQENQDRRRKATMEHYTSANRALNHHQLQPTTGNSTTTMQAE